MWIAPLVSGHASMIMPPARNAIDSETPAWSHGKHPPTGFIEPYTCACTNGTEVRTPIFVSLCPRPTIPLATTVLTCLFDPRAQPECNSGQACFWFSQGCVRYPRLAIPPPLPNISRQSHHPFRVPASPSHHLVPRHPVAPPAHARTPTPGARSGASNAMATALGYRTSTTAPRTRRWCPMPTRSCQSTVP